MLSEAKQDDPIILYWVSMGEIIQIQIGQAGHRIGYSFWEELVQEHSLDKSGKLNELLLQPSHGKRHVFFREEQDNAYRARSIFADMDSRSISNIYQSQLSSIFPYDNSCYDTVGTRNLWPVGYKAGIATKENVLDSIRKEAEKCDRLCGFNVIHSVCGGSGSGLGSLILQNLQEQFKDAIIMPITGCPSPKISNIVVQPYNCLLAMERLINIKNHPCILFENSALFEVHKRRDPKRIGTLSEINSSLAVAVANLTSSFRFPCDGNVSWKKLACNMLEYPSRKFLTMSLPYEYYFEKGKVGNMVKHQLFANRNWSVSLEQNVGRKMFFKHKWLANYFVFRGEEWSSFDVNYRISQELSRKIKGNKLWKDQKILRQIPHSYLACVVKSAPHRPKGTVTSLQNSSIVRQFLSEIHDKISKMMQRKAYLHNFTNEGLEMDELNQAQTFLLDTLSEYQVMVEDSQCTEEFAYE